MARFLKILGLELGFMGIYDANLSESREEREEGREEVPETGIKKVALKMLKNNADIRFVGECTGLTQKKF